MNNSSPIPINIDSLYDMDQTKMVVFFSVLRIPVFPPVLKDGKELVHWRIQLRWQKNSDPGVLARDSVLVCLDTQRMSEDDSRVEVEITSRPEVVSEYTRRGDYWRYDIPVTTDGLTDLSM